MAYHVTSFPGVREKFEARGWGVDEAVTFPLGIEGWPICHVADDKQGGVLILSGDTFLRIPWEALDQARER